MNATAFVKRTVEDVKFVCVIHYQDPRSYGLITEFGLDQLLRVGLAVCDVWDA